MKAAKRLPAVMRLRVLLLALLASPLGLAPAGADASAPVRVPDWRVGDAWTVDVVSVSTFPFLDRQVTFRDEYRESAVVELGTLLYADGRPHEVAWSNRSILLPGYERPFLARHATDLTTGESLLSPAFLSYTYGPTSFDLLGLGVYRENGFWNDTLDLESFDPVPEVTLHALVGGVDLAPGVVVQRTLDFRPAHDVVVESTFTGLAYETLDGREALRGSLTQARTERGVTGAPQEATLWLADDVPLPLRLVADAAAYPVSYHHEAVLLAYAPGGAPLPRGACDEPHGAPAPAVPVETAPYGRDEKRFSTMRAPRMNWIAAASARARICCSL